MSSKRGRSRSRSRERDDDYEGAAATAASNSKNTASFTARVAQEKAGPVEPKKKYCDDNGPCVWCVCIYVCVCERERERVCVCVCERAKCGYLVPTHSLSLSLSLSHSALHCGHTHTHAPLTQQHSLLPHTHNTHNTHTHITHFAFAGHFIVKLGESITPRCMYTHTHTHTRIFIFLRFVCVFDLSLSVCFISVQSSPLFTPPLLPTTTTSPHAYTTVYSVWLEILLLCV
jgi:hypothetical protein